MQSRKPIEYVIFDMDGLMIDSERIYTDVTNDILAPYGVEMTWEMKAGLMGKPDRASAAHLLSFFPDIPLTIDDYLAQRTRAQHLRWPHMQLLPGVARLVAHLAAHGVPLAIATGSTRRNFERKTAHLQHAFAHFGASNVVCSDDGAVRPGRSKPFPDVFLAAARSLGRAVGGPDDNNNEEEREERARGLVFEDAILGVQAGKRAGMSVVWVPDQNLLDIASSQLAADKPDQVLSSLEAFVPEEWGLPPFDDAPAVSQEPKSE
ncbi:HAD-like protein [Russula compacta]|nr:HAD-like protein [Russula compacta]